MHGHVDGARSGGDDKTGEKYKADPRLAVRPGQSRQNGADRSEGRYGDPPDPGTSPGELTCCFNDILEKRLEDEADEPEDDAKGAARDRFSNVIHGWKLTGWA